MRVAVIAPIILAAVAACSTRPAYSECSPTRLEKREERRVATSGVCSELPKFSGRARGQVDCAALCGPSFTWCSPDGAYVRVWSAAQPEGGAENACPDDPLTSDGTTKVVCEQYVPNEDYDPDESCPIEGRRPERLLPPLHIEDASALASYLATSAHLESAAVLAFEHLIVELEAHGAPAELVAEARVARVDEIRHARAVGDLARRFGGLPSPARMAATPVRDLLAIALENEVEGIVRETLGAALATWRATHAEDAEVRGVMDAIARDERAHAELSWRLGEWLASKLSSSERALVRSARLLAIAQLRATFAVDPADDVIGIAGAPRARDVQTLLTRLERDLWMERSAA